MFSFDKIPINFVYLRYKFLTEIILVFNCDAQNYCNNRYSTGTINKFDTVEGNDTTKNKTAQHEVSQGFRLMLPLMEKLYMYMIEQ